MQIETGMENENEMVIKRLSVPLGLEELMENLTKEVLRRRPADVYAFASEHFAQLLALRDTGCYKTSFMKIKKTPSQVSAESLKGTQGAKQPPLKIKSAMLGTMEAAPKSLGNRKKLPSPRSKSIASDSPVLSSDRAKQILDKHMAKKQSAGDKSKIDPKGKAAVKIDGGQRKSGSKKATPQKDVQVKKSAKQIKALQTGEKKSQTKNDKTPPPVQGGGLKRSETETPKSNESEIPKGNEAKTPRGNETGTPKGNEIEKPKGNEKESVKQNRIEIPGTDESETSNGNETEPPKSNEVETPKENEKQTLNDVEILGHNESETPQKGETKTPRGSDESEGPKEEALPKMENAIGEELKADSKKETISNNQELKQEASGQFGAKIENGDGVSASKQQNLDETNQNKNEDVNKAFEVNVDDLTKAERDAKVNEFETQGSLEDESKVITKEEAETKNDLKLNNGPSGNIVKIVSEEKLTKEEKEDVGTETEKGKVDASLNKKQENVIADGKPKEMAANQNENNLKSEAVEEAQKDEKQMGITSDEASQQQIENAVVSIQAGWRGYQIRKRLQKTVEPKPGDLVNAAENENLQVNVDKTNANDIQAKQNETLLRQETVTISKDGVTEEFSAKTAAQTQLAPKTPSNLGEDAKSSVRNEVEKLEEQRTEGDTTLSSKEEKEEKIVAQKEVEVPEPQNHLTIKKTEEDEGQRDEGSEDLLAKSTNAAVKIQAYVRGHLARQKSIYRNNSETNLTKSSSANDENNNDEKKVVSLPPKASEHFRKTFVQTISESDHDELHPVNENFDQTKAKELTRAFVEYEQQNYQAVKTSRPNKGGSQLEGPKSERGVLKDEENELFKEKSKMENLGKSKSPVFGRSMDVDAPAIGKLAVAQNNVENAAVKIQSLWRGHVIRRHIKNLELKNLQKPTECDDLPGDRLSVKDLIKAATVIQALFRGYSVRKHFKNEKMETTFRREKSFEEKLPTVLEVEDDGDNEDGPKEKTITIHEDPIPYKEKAESKDDNQREETESKENKRQEAKKLSDEEVLTALENVPVPPRTPDILGRSSAGALRRSEAPLKKNLSVSDLHAKNAPEEAFDLKETRSHLVQPPKAEESDIHEDIAEIANSIKEDVVKLKRVLGDDAIPRNEEGDASEINAHLLELAGSMKEDAQKLQETLSNETGMDQAVNKSEEKAIPNEDFGKVKKDGQTTNKSEEKPEMTIPNEDPSPFGKESTTLAEDNQTTNKSEKSIPNEDPELLSRPVSKESTTSADSVDTVIFNDQKPRKKPTRADTILPENYIQDNLETSMQNLSLDQFDEVSSGSTEDKQTIPMEEEAPPKMPQRQEEPPVKHQVKFRLLGELKEDSGENDASERERRLGEVKEQSSDLVTDVIDTAAKKIQKFFRRHRGKGRRKFASTTEILKQTQSTFSSSEDDKDAAATAIQKTYRGYRVRRDLQSRKIPAGEDDVEYDKKEKEIDREITNLLKSITAPVRRAFSADAKEKVEAKEKLTEFKEEGDTPNYVYIPLRDYSSEESQELAMPSKSRAGSKVDIYMPHFAASEDASNDSRTESHSEGTSTSKNVTTSEYSAEDISDKCKSIENKMEFEQKGVQIEEATDKEEPKLQGSRQAEPVEEDERGAEFVDVKSTAKLAETQQGMKEEDKVLEGRKEQKMVVEAQKPPKEEKQTNEGIANAAITQYINSLIEPIKQAFSADKNKADRKSAIDKDVGPSVKDEGPIYIPLRDYSDESPEKPSRDELGFQNDRKKREVLEQEPAQKIVEEPNGNAQEQSSNKAPDVSHLELKPVEIEEMRHAEQSKRAQSLNDLEAQILNELGLTEGEPGCKNEVNFKEDAQSKTVSEEAKASKDQRKNNGAENDDKAKLIPQKQFTIEKLNGMEEGSGKKEETKSATEFQGQSLTQSAEEKIPSGNSTVKEEALIQNDPNTKLPKTDVSPPNEVTPKRSLSTSHGMSLEKSEGNPKDHKVELVENHVVKGNADPLTMETKEKVQAVGKSESKENNEEQKRESASLDGKSISRETDDDSIQDASSKKGNVIEPSDDNQAIGETGTSPVTLPSKTDQVASSMSKENKRNLEENSTGKVKEEKEGSSKESDSAIGQKEGKAEDASGKPMELEVKVKLEENSTEAVEEEKGKGKKAHGDSPKDPVVMGVIQKDEARSTDKRGEDGKNQLGLEEDAKIPESCLEKEESTSNGNEKLIVKAQDDGEPQREKASELSDMKQNENFANSKGNSVKNLKEEKATDSEQAKQSVEALTLVPNKTEDEKPSLEKTVDIPGETLTKLESQVIPAPEGENKDNQEENKNAQRLDLGMPTALSSEDAIKNETVRNEKGSGHQDGKNENRHKDEATATQTNEGEKNVKHHMNTLKSIESGPSITKEEETSFDPKLESITGGENSQQQIVDDGNSEDVQILVENKVKNEREHNQNLKAEETKVDIKEGAADITENVEVNLTPEGGHVDVKTTEIKPIDSDTHLAHPIQKEDQQSKIEEACEKRVAAVLGEERKEDLTQPSQKGDYQSKIEETREVEREGQRSLGLAEDKESAHSIQQGKVGEIGVKGVTTSLEEEKSSDLTQPTQKGDQKSKIEETREEEREEQRSLDLAEDKEGSHPIQKEEQQSKIVETHEEGREEQKSLDLAEYKENSYSVQEDEQQSKIIGETEAEERVVEKPLDLAAEDDVKGKDLLKGELETSDPTSKKGYKMEESYMSTIKEEEEVNKGEAASQEVQKDSKAFDQKDRNDDKADEETSAKSTVNAGIIKDIDAAQRNEKLEDEGHELKNAENRTRDDLAKKESKIEEDLKQKSVTENLAQAQTLLRSSEANDETLNVAKDDVLDRSVKLEGLGGGKTDDLEETKVDLTKEENNNGKQTLLQTPEETDVLAQGVKLKDKGEESAKVESPNLTSAVTSQLIEENKSIALTESIQADELVMEEKAKESEPDEQRTENALPCLDNYKVEKEESPAGQLDAVVKEEGKKFGESFDLEATPEIAKIECDAQPKNDVKEFTEEKKTTLMESKVSELPNQPTIEGASQQLIAERLPEGIGQEPTLLEKSKATEEVKEDEGKKSKVETRTEEDVPFLKDENATMLGGPEESTPISSTEFREIQLPIDEWPKEDKLQGDSGNQSGATEDMPGRTAQVTDGPKTAGNEEERHDVATVEDPVQATQITESESPSSGAEKTPGGSMEPKESELLSGERPEGKAGLQSDGEKTENITEGTVQLTDAPKTAGKEEERQDVASIEGQVQATHISESESPLRGKGPSNDAEKTLSGSMESKESKLHGNEGPKEEAGVQGDGKNQLDAAENISGGTVQVTEAPKTAGKEEERQDVASVEDQVQSTHISESETPIRGKGPSNGAEKTPGGSMESKESKLHGNEGPKEEAGVQGDGKNQSDAAENIPGGTVQVTDAPKTAGKEEERQDVASVEDQVQSTHISESESPIRGKGPSNGAEKTPGGSMESKESKLHGNEGPKEEAGVQGDGKNQLDAAENIPGGTVQVTEAPKTAGKEEERQDVASVEGQVQATQISESESPIEGKGPSNGAEKTPAGSVESKETELHGDKRPKEEERPVQVTDGPKTMGKEEDDVASVESLAEGTQMFQSDSSMKGKNSSSCVVKTPGSSMESKENELHGEERPKEAERPVQVTDGPKTMGKEEERGDVASVESLVQATQMSETESPMKGQSLSNFAEAAPAGLMEPKESDLHAGERPKEDKLRGDRENQSGATGNVPEGTVQATDGSKAAEEIFESGTSIKDETEPKENELLPGDWPKEVVEEDKQQGNVGGQSNTSENIPKATEVTEEESVDSLDATIKLEDRSEAAEIFKPESTEASKSVPEEKSAPFYLHQDSYSKSPTTLQEKAFAEALKNASSDVGKTPQTEEGERLLHSGEFHDSIPLKVASEKAARDATVDPRPPPLLAHSGELHDNIIPLVLQMNDAPAGTEAVTSRREASVSVGAQASDKDVSAAREDAPDTTQQHSQPSSGMDTEKRNNSAIVRKSMEAEAATKIQASFRGYQVRKQLKGRNTGGAISSNRRSSRRKSSGRISDSKRAALQNKTNPSQLEQESATKIQAGIRGFLVRRRQKKEKKSNKKTPESG